jgi:hypothetical protein
MRNAVCASQEWAGIHHGDTEARSKAICGCYYSIEGGVNLRQDEQDLRDADPGNASLISSCRSCSSGQNLRSRMPLFLHVSVVKFGGCQFLRRTDLPYMIGGWWLQFGMASLKINRVGKCLCRRGFHFGNLDLKGLVGFSTSFTMKSSVVVALWGAFAVGVTFSGCDAAMQQVGQELLQPPAGKKSILSPQEWKLSDQSQLSAVVEMVESADGNGSFGSMVITHTPVASPLKALEFGFEVDGNPQAEPTWNPIPSAGPQAAGPQGFRMPFSAPDGSKVLFRVQVGEQPEFLAPWTLSYGDEEKMEE